MLQLELNMVPSIQLNKKRAVTSDKHLVSHFGLIVIETGSSETSRQ